MNFLSKIKSNRIASNTVWIMGERIFQLALSLILSVLTARYLGPSDFGVISYMASIVTFLSPVAMLGLDSVLLKKIIENPEKEGVYLGSSLILRLLSSIMCSIVGILFIYLTNPSDNIKIAIIAIQILQLVFQSLQVFDIWFQRYLNSKNTSIAKVIGAIVVAIYRIYILVNSKSIIWFAFSNTLLSMVIGIVLLYKYYVSDSQKLRFELSYGLDLLKESYHFIISGMIVVLYTQMDKIMIEQMLGSGEVGFYSTAISLCAFWGFIPGSIITSLKPSILEALPNKRLFLKRLKRLYSIIIWFSIIISIFICLFAKPIILVLYGEVYSPSIQVLQIAVWFEMFSVIGSARGVWIIAENKNKYVKYYLSIGAVVNLALNYILIPTIGINGAAIATVITQFTTAIIAPLLFKETREHTIIVIDSLFMKGS